MEISPKTRVNAAIAYFFLGPLFLVARRNPNFSDPFVRSHAAAASKIMAFYAVAFFGYSWFFSEYLAFSLPIFPISLDRIVSSAILALFVATLFRGAFRAHAGKWSASVFDVLGFLRFSDTGAETIAPSKNLSETARTLAVLSFVPIFGIVVAARKPSPETALWARSWSVFFILYALSFASSGDATLMALTLAYAVFFVTVAIFLVSSGKIPGFELLSNVPSLETVYRVLRTLPAFLSSVGSAVFWKRKELSFAASYARTIEKDAATEAVLEKGLSDVSFPISPNLIALPVVNLLFLPRLFSSVPYRYAFMASQGVALTAAYAALAAWDGFSSPYQIFFLPAMALLLGNVQMRPFYRIPLLSEVSSLVGFLTFGLSDRAKKITQASKKETSVRFKV